MPIGSGAKFIPWIRIFALDGIGLLLAEKFNRLSTVSRPF